jgi:hypothetical protein
MTFPNEFTPTFISWLTQISFSLSVRERIPPPSIHQNKHILFLLWTVLLIDPYKSGGSESIINQLQPTLKCIIGYSSGPHQEEKLTILQKPTIKRYKRKGIALSGILQPPLSRRKSPRSVDASLLFTIIINRVNRCP